VNYLGELLYKMAKPKAEHIRPECIGCGACVAIAPDFWQMDDNDNKADLKKCRKTMNGSEIVKEELEIDDKDFQINKDAAESCPVNCIHIYDKEGKKVI